MSGPDGVRFLMQDGTDEIPCRISYETLSGLGQVLGLTEVGEVFVIYRHRIERAASAKYDRTSRREHEVVVLTLDDLRAPLSEP